ncbi:MAG: sterol desaturase family protein [Ignavibacteriaceae bacterium]|jgi:sterol desaturase/sphingolipid hydroxylase (fatty acid hydroxylase superfamily)|nr:sterol desaturase family protein [Ignavibacteriaceae bacterium]
MAKNFVSNKDETVRMFKSDFMEALSKVHPSVPVIIYLPVILYMFYLSVFKFEISASGIIGLFVFGIFVWTLTEYLLHRFVFHLKLKSELGKRIHFIFHGVHHDYPSDSKRLVMPPSVSIPLAVLFYFLFYYLIGNIFVHPFFAGFLTGYLFYDMTHYAVHHFNMHSKFWLAIKHHHIKHHFQDSEKGYGVSSPLWDEVFGTTFSEKEKPKT